MITGVGMSGGAAHGAQRMPGKTLEELLGIAPKAQRPQRRQPAAAPARRTCNRCTTPTTAAELSRAVFEYEGHRHELELCGACGDTYEAQMLAWVRVAHEPTGAFADAPAGPRPLRTLPPPVRFPVIKRPETVIEDEAENTGYSFTFHAAERMEERGVTAAQVYAALRARTVVKPGQVSHQEMVYHDGVKVVIDTDAREIITVATTYLGKKAAGEWQ